MNGYQNSNKSEKFAGYDYLNNYQTQMKIVKILMGITLSVLSGYLLYRLFAVEKLAQLDYMLLILLLLIGMINLVTVLIRRKKDKEWKSKSMDLYS
jgi:high-affinity Fe2+/Pb2+ permease